MSGDSFAVAGNRLFLVLFLNLCMQFKSTIIFVKKLWKNNSKGFKYREIWFIEGDILFALHAMYQYLFYYYVNQPNCCKFFLVIFSKVLNALSGNEAQ